MIQQFVELGEGYGDIYELCEVVRTNKQRFHNAFVFISNNEKGKKVASLAVALKPAAEGKFMPIYICREGIPYDEEKRSKRLEIFEKEINDLDRKTILVETKHSSIFSESRQFYQYLIGILRLNHYIPPMS